MSNSDWITSEEAKRYKLLFQGRLLDIQIEDLENENKDLKVELDRSKEYAAKALKHIENDSEIAAKLVLRKIIKGEKLDQVVLDELLEDNGE